MSEFSKRLSDKILRGIRNAETNNGPRHAGEVAEAHIDAGVRYLDEDGEREWHPPVVTEMQLQNQI